MNSKRKCSVILDSVALHRICSIRILDLYGEYNDYLSIDSAIRAIQKQPKISKRIKFIKFEIIIKFKNGGKVEAQFSNKIFVLEFLRFFKK